MESKAGVLFRFSGEDSIRVESSLFFSLGIGSGKKICAHV